MSYNSIPAMTDPLSRHWDQPADIRQAPMDDTHVLLSTAQVAQLKNYSHSVPTGTYDGKCWRAEDKNGKYLCWYEPSEKPGIIAIKHRIILEVKPDE